MILPEPSRGMRRYSGLSVGEPEHDPLRARGHVRIILTGVLILALLVSSTLWLLWDNHRLQVSRVEVSVPGLAQDLDGTRIVQISDLHAADHRGFHERILAETAAASPDVIALTGDLIDVRTQDTTATRDLLTSLGELAPTYAVLGSHEADSSLRDQFLDDLDTAGVEVLRGRTTTATLDGGALHLGGLDDPRVYRADGRDLPDTAQETARLVAGQQGPLILLAHRPELLEDYAAGGASVVLSGHAHGGQVRIPFVGGLFAPHQGVLPELTEGVHTEAGTQMVISRGLGNSILGVRVNNPRELVVVTLRAV